MARARKTAEPAVSTGVGESEARRTEHWVPGAPAWSPERQPVPKGSKWELRGEKSRALLHEGISASNAPHLLAGRTSKPLADVEVGGECVTLLDDRRYVLKRTS